MLVSWPAEKNENVRIRQRAIKIQDFDSWRSVIDQDSQYFEQELVAT
jgi:hypothetical protein